jgi:hypothetical protein
MTATAVCSAALFASTSALADVTAADVWADWQKSYVGYTEDQISIGKEEMSGNTLTITDLRLSVKDEFSKSVTVFSQLQFVENGDGTVQVIVPDTIPMVMSFDDVRFKMNLMQTGVEMVVSGEPDNMTYDTTADRYTLSVSEIDGVTGDIEFSASDVVSKTVSKDLGEMRDMSGTVTSGLINALVNVTIDDSEDDYITFSGTIDGFTANGSVALPADFDMENPEDMFTTGFNMAGGYGVNTTNYVFDANIEGEQVAGSISSGAARVDVSFDRDAVSYSANMADMAMQMQMPMMPFPISMSLAEYGAGLEIPLATSDAPSPFGMNFDLIDLSVSEDLWMLFDPAGSLPHDPATLSFAISGAANMLFDLFDPEQADDIEMSDGMLAELDALSLDRMKLALAGAVITGKGDFTFDNTDLTTFDGFPRPMGAIDFDIKGANGLMDTLVSMGLLPEDQAMMGRMMMGMFARTVGEDHLTSKIEITEEAHILANGQRIQ